jgi:hypothetical protein
MNSDVAALALEGKKLGKVSYLAKRKSNRMKGLWKILYLASLAR